MLHCTTHTSLSISLFFGFSSMGGLPANSREENSPQEQQQHSNANHMPRPNLNVLIPQPRLPINSDDSDSEYENDEYFGDEDSEDNEQEEVKQEIRQLKLRLFLSWELTNMMMRKKNNVLTENSFRLSQELQHEITQIVQEIENLERRIGRSVL
ncbi:hypothetical protein ES332_D06G108500v1 [Gossypium tomentosum]|uniref:K-box domain-containing protein n=1 Tax=Gossypium tomentosum TaxID=34277 RepID=A0A5D2KH42_GOSTO|nr:hypothetical protein ES332_D06G108500v1 [Gossypium tomentosum]